MKSPLICLVLLFSFSGISAQLIDYNKIILPENAQNVSFEERLVQVAWKNNPSSHMAIESVNTARLEERVIAGDWTNSVAVSGNLNEYNIKNFTDQTNTGNIFFPRYNFTIRLPLALLVELPRRREVSQSRIILAQDAVNQTKLAIRSRVLRLYSEYKKMELIWIIRKQTMEDEESNYLLAEQKFKDGEGNIEEFIRVQRSRNEQKIMLATAENDFTKAKLDLEEVIGVRIEDVK